LRLLPNHLLLITGGNRSIIKRKGRLGSFMERYFILAIAVTLVAVTTPKKIDKRLESAAPSRRKEGALQASQHATTARISPTSCLHILHSKPQPEFSVVKGSIRRLLTRIVSGNS
jgi:hypothetical protein